ncbi:PolC-type DNA polymerase III [Facklamia miroungae]|uniref:DNA polymerase III PolC-type n=1 Tax=Facklamia miroungae TaxID=120956 RepID=A0A1G7P3P1_9LACT|nr:PolC-type DNA polymerase III [Facklamia miroungae]NKZ28569.1 PolC-type DNA polymerase III [Facklamia miroungae]SDF80873.1 DNA polymerase-3 subunit alpha [Facklamia miroungae]
MGKEQTLFDILLEQLNITDPDILSSLAGGQIEQVEVLANSQCWKFHLAFPERIHPDLYLIIMKAMCEAFSDIVKTEIWWHFQADDPNNIQIIEDYWEKIKEVMMDETPFLKICLQDSSFTYDPDTQLLEIGLASQSQVDMFDNKYDQVIRKYFEQVGFEGVTFTYYVDQAISEANHQTTKQRLEELDQQNLLAALENEEKKQEKQKQTEISPEVKPVGKEIPNIKPTPILDLPDHQYKQVIEGYVFAKDTRDLRSGEVLSILKLTDYTSSVAVKLISGRRLSKDQIEQFQVGDWLRMEGDMVPDNYSGEFDFRPRSIRKLNPAKRQDTFEGQKRVELHLHSNMSQMDATNTISDYIKTAARWGHSAIAITDHAGAQAFPEAYYAGKENQIKVIYGIEANIVNDGEEVAYNERDLDLSEANYVVFDVETTGLSSVYDRMIELAAVKMHKGNVIDTFEAFINPGHPLSSFTTELTGITDAMLEGAPSEEDVVNEFLEFTKDTILVAHNASFDMGFINQAYVRHGFAKTDLPVIDTLALSRLVNPHMKGHRLNNLAKHYGVNLEQHHRAIYDSETTGHILFKLLEQANDQYQMTHHYMLNQEMGKGDAYKQVRPFHATLIAKNQAGLKDLFKLISISNVDYFYREPRIPRSVLNQYRENLLVGSGCSDGEVFMTLMQKGYQEASELVAYYDYLEIQPPSVYDRLIEESLIRSREDLFKIMQEMVKLANEHNKLLVATGDVHYLEERDSVYREILLKSLKRNANRDLHFPPLHFRTTNEMVEEFSFLGKELAYELVVTNSNKIADLVQDDIEVIHSKLFTPNIEGSDQKIRDLAYGKAYEMYGNPLPELIEKRLEKELHSIISNGFAVIYLISQKLVLKSNQDGYLVGSRGSVGSSFVATMTGITEVNPLAPHYYCPDCHFNEFFTDGSVGSGFDLPVKDCPSCGKELKRDGQDIPFETFLGFKGDKVPDIDLNFSGEYQPQAHAYTKELFGEDHVFRAGTISTVAQKTAFGYVKGYLENTMTQVPQAEKERLAKGIEGVKRTTGQHPGGIIVIPEYMDVYDFTPIQFPAEDIHSEWRTTHFDFHSIHDNVLKLDILGHDDPTMIRFLQDISGIDPKDISFSDPDVMSLFSGTEALGVTKEQIFSDTGTLGVPEFGTNFVRGMLTQTKPSTFAELLQISGLSHGTDVWLGNAEELIQKNIVPLAKVIGCRDDIMVTLMQYGLEDSLAFKIMEHVRKGRGIPEEWQAEMRANNVPEWYIESCLKIKYMFPKAHAAAYIMMALRVAYFKVHYPKYYYAAYFSVRASDFDIIAMHQGKEMVKHRLREIMAKGMEASVKENSLRTVLELANEMLERGLSFQMIDLEKSDASNFIIDGESLIPPFRSIPGLGAGAAKSIVQAREEAPFISKEDLQKRGKVSKTIMEYLEENGVLANLPDEDQLSLF